MRGNSAHIRYADREQPRTSGDRGCDVLDLAKTYGTPVYVIDESAVRDRCRSYLRAFRSKWPHVDVAYASKAFLVGEMVRLATEEGLSLDVVSAGELRLALWAGASPSKITFHGNYKTREDIELAVCSRVRSLVIDCLDEIDLIDRQAREHGRVQDVDIRLNLGIDIHTDPKYTTGDEESKFGLPVRRGTRHQQSRESSRATTSGSAACTSTSAPRYWTRSTTGRP